MWHGNDARSLADRVHDLFILRFQQHIFSGGTFV